MASWLPIVSPRHRLRTAAAVAASAVVGVVGGAGHGSADSTSVAPERDVSAPLSAAGCTTRREERQTREFTLRLPSSQGDRTAVVRVPARTAVARSPLVVALHGSGSSGRFMKRYSGLAEIGDEEGFTVAFPDATPQHRVWNLNAGSAPDDVGFVEELIEQVATVACVDPGRVFVVGVSNGGGLAARVGCELSGRVSGIVVVAGGFGGLPQCRPHRPVSVLEIHGSNDPVVPYRGDPRHGGAGDVRAWLAGWAQRDRCGSTMRPRTMAPRALRFDWRGCAPGTKLAHIQVLGGGHQWPGAKPPDPGPPSTFSAGQQAWQFLASLRAPRDE
ncbi:MAG TPA: PHB depolymerase family esterase [Solirubrobacteraceae bacterium]